MVGVASVDGAMELPDGRRIGYRLRGGLDRSVLVYLHGSPGSRAESGFFADEELATAAVSMLALDRPGYGLSDPVPDVDIAARARDLLQACDLLGVDRFAVVGTSGGGTYALAVAAAAPERVGAVITVSGQARLDTTWAFDGMAPDIAADWLSKSTDQGRQQADEMVGAVAVPGEQALAVWESWFEGFPADEIAFVRAAGDVFVEDGQELSRQGGHGYWIDELTRARPWPFDTQDLSMPIHVFHGTADTWNPCRPLLTDLGSAPRMSTTLYQGGNHLSPLITSPRRKAILDAARNAL
jgi:pimeloyl-ACP methyl ester carboxylesterase